jgi:hypothetical protein
MVSPGIRPMAVSQLLKRGHEPNWIFVSVTIYSPPELVLEFHGL